ncbi:MAG: methyltransferase domain-containing protein [Streptomycetales bacterium]
MSAPVPVGARAAQQELARVLLACGALDPEWEAAYWAAPRHLFLPEVMWVRQDDDTYVTYDRNADPGQWWEQAYRNTPIVTQFDDGLLTGCEPGERPTSSSSMPLMVFEMLKHLDVAAGQRVLEIGTGTGWNAALLAARVGDHRVVSVEVDQGLHAEACRALRAAGRAITAVVADGAGGWPAGAPYDRILATCSVTSIPSAWIDQCWPGGMVLVPWVPLYGGEGLARLTVTGSGSASGPFVGSSAFMPLRAHRFSRIPHGRYLPQEWPGDADASVTDLAPTQVVDDWITEFAIGVQLPDVYWIKDPYDDGTHTLWLYDQAVTSWASADYEPDRNTYQVYQSGPRRLWNDVHSAWQWWQDHGQPGFDRFGLTVTPHAHQVWLDNPGQVLAAPSSSRPRKGTRHRRGSPTPHAALEG